jgi:hypothetical protein
MPIRLRTGALACLCLIWAPFRSFAQTDNHTTVVPLEDAATAPSTNVAAASLDRALARAVMAEFSPLLELAFSPDQAQGNPQGQTKQDQTKQDQTKPPATNPAAPTLEDLGLSPAQTQGNAQDQARLDKRSHMLKVHQRLGIITTIPLLATVLTGSSAGGKTSSSTSRDLHAALGSATTGLYLTTAYFSIFAPRVPGTTSRGPIRLHKALAWIHGPGMILTPILGVMAFDQRNRGEKVHGIASAHGAVAVTTAVAYGLAILSVSVRF